jgi:hypothetical protein
LVSQDNWDFDCSLSACDKSAERGAIITAIWGISIIWISIIWVSIPGIWVSKRRVWIRKGWVWVVLAQAGIVWQVVVIVSWVSGRRKVNWGVNSSLDGVRSVQNCNWALEQRDGSNSNWGGVSSWDRSYWGISYWGSSYWGRVDWLDSTEWSQELSKLTLGDGAVSIGINSSDDGNEFTFSGESTLSSEELTKVEHGDWTGSCESLDRVEGGECREFGANSEVLLEGLKSSLKVDFLLDDLANCHLNVSREELTWKNRWSISGDSSISEIVVLAWQTHLDELIECESLVTIAIEETNKVVGLRFGNAKDSVVSQESTQLSRCDLTITRSINSLESSSWDKVWDATEALSCVFEVSLTFTYGEEEICESSFGF